MSAAFPLLGGALLGVAAGALLVPVTRRQLAAAAARAASDPGAADAGVRSGRMQWAAVAIASGLIPALVVFRVGWSANALPPLVLLVGLVQLASCDLARRLLPKPLVWWLTAAVIGSGMAVATALHEAERLRTAALGGAALFVVFLLINLFDPRWLAFGDVRLSLVVGFGLAWISPMALFEGFFLAHLLAAASGLCLVAVRRGDRHTALPFGLYLTLATALVVLVWS